MADICKGCFNLILDYCGENITLPTGLAEGTKVWWEITDKFGEVWRGSAIVDDEGEIDIEVDQFPEGLFNPHAGNFNFIIGAEGDDAPSLPLCDIIDLTICGTEYECITFSFTKTNYVEDITEPYYPDTTTP